VSESMNLKPGDILYGTRLDYSGKLRAAVIIRQHADKRTYDVEWCEMVDPDGAVSGERVPGYVYYPSTHSNLTTDHQEALLKTRDEFRELVMYTRSELESFERGLAVADSAYVLKKTEGIK